MTHHVLRRTVRALLSVAPEAAAICCLLGMIWWGIGATLSIQRADALDGATRDTTNLAHAFAENTNRVIASADQILLELRAAYQRDPDHFDLRAWVKTESAPDWLRAQIAIIGPDGISRASTASTSRVSVADRAHFTAQRDSNVDELYISTPVIGRSSGRWTIQLTRKILLPGSAFAGIAVLSVDCYQLSAFYESLNLQQGYIELFGLDRVVRARGPVKADTIGSPVELPAAVEDLVLQRPSGVLHTEDRPRHPNARDVAPRDSITFAYRRLAAYPLVVSVAFNDKSVLRPYRRARAEMLLAGVLASVIIIGVGSVWLRQRKRSIRSQESLELALESMDQGLIMVDADARVRVVNRRALELFELPVSLLTRSHAGRRRQAGEHEVLAALAGDWTRRGAAGQRIVERRSSPTASGDTVHTITDVTAREAANNRIRHMALHDHLTGLGNRVLFAEEADHHLQTAHASQAQFGILCLDLNGFKRVNDTLGHDVGDALLIAVAARLKASVPPGDVLARTGGDEFAILSRDPNQPSASRDMAARICAALEQPFSIGGAQARIGVSVGIALFPNNGATRSELLRNADLALYASKADPKREVRSFEPAMAAVAQTRQQFEEDLRLAIGSEQIQVAYQPQFRTASLAVTGFEALVRWSHPERGLLRPDMFIPIAEETGLIVPLGRQVLETACRTALTWPRHIHVAVNISPTQFRDPRIVDTVAAVIESTGLPAARLQLEVTEGVLIADEEKALETMQRLCELGVTLALDDFGTGYASLSYLRKYPFGQIKLDRSFVQAQVVEERSRHILQAILSLSRRLRLTVVAEGVETKTQLRMLREQGCHFVQGFLFGRPMPAEDTARFFDANAPQHEAALTENAS